MGSLVIAAFLLSTCLSAAACGQDWTLGDRVQAPTLYVSVEADFAQRLLDLWPASAPARLLPAEARDRVSDAELGLLGRVCQLCDGALEVAYDAGQRELLLHCVLPEAARRRVQALLDDGDVLRRVEGTAGQDTAGHAMYSLAEGAIADAPALFLALVDRHLCMATGPGALTRLLREAPPRGRALTDDADFRDFSRRVEADRPALTLFGSFGTLSEAFAHAFGVTLPGLDISGFDDATSLLLSVRTRSEGLAMSVLVRRKSASAIDGWLAVADRAQVGTLLAELPPAGIASLTLAVDPKALRKLDAGPVLGLLSKRVHGGCETLGLNLEQQILTKLKGVAALQVLVNEAGRPLGSAYLAKLKTERDAQRIYADCRRVLTARSTSRAVPHQHGEELILPTLGPLADGSRFGIVRDNLVLGTTRGVVEQIAALDRGAETSSLVDLKWVPAALRALPAAARTNQVAGILVVDLSPLLADSSRDDAALRRHAGVLRVQPDHLRLELFSQL